MGRGAVVGYNFRPYNRDQMYLLPPSMHDWLPEDHLAWFLVDAVDQMDLRPFLSKYRSDGWGAPSYDPSVMVCLLLYAYCLGERSSRRIERLCQEDIAFRVVSANQMPDHCTIARFRRRHEQELAGLFVEVLKLCHAAGLVKVGTVALDGTKMKANASFAANRTYEGLKREVERMLAEAEETDRAEDETHGPGNSGNSLPEGLRSRRERLERLKACKERLEREAAERAAKQQAKVDERRAREEATGKKLRGRKPKAPDASVDKNARANPTDPDSRIMSSRQHGLIQGYNGQAVVTEDQIIIAAKVTQDCSDVHQLHPMLDQARTNLDAAGIPDQIEVALADAGYWCEENSRVVPNGPELYINTTKDWKLRKAIKKTSGSEAQSPRHLTPRQRMEQKLSTEAGWAIYKKRAQTVEPTFGQIKDGRNCDRFMSRGLSACDSEWQLLCLTHNLLKLWRHVAGRLSRASVTQPSITTCPT